MKGRGQSKTGSAAEAVTNVAVGMAMAFVSQEIIFACYGIRVSRAANIEIVLWFTAISIVRSFLLRRLFNWITIR